MVKKRPVKRSSQDLKKFNEDLDDRVKSRTAELENINRQLRQEIETRTRTERELQHRNARLRAIVDTAADAIFTVDGQGSIESYNPAAVSMFKYAPQEILGKNIRTLIPQLQWSQRGTERRELAGHCRDGSAFPIDLIIKEIRLEDRRGFAIIARNLSERQMLERQVLEVSTREQERISHDLHDRVGQELTGLGYLAAGLGQELASSPLAETAARIVHGLNRAMGEVRSAIRGLTPVAVEDNGLAAALEGLAARTREQYGINCWFPGDRAMRLANNRIATHLYLIAQEAVHNAVKHARAKEIRVALGESNGRVVLAVSDDGVGMARHVQSGENMGLTIMRYRAGEIGATLSIEGDDGCGTRVTCSLPQKEHHA
jgi:PAS domain S-box-containing protein